MQAEMENRPFTYTGLDPNMAFQASIYGQRQAEFNYKLENYQQKADSLSATIARANADIVNFGDRLAYAKTLEQMRKDLERLNVGSRSIRCPQWTPVRRCRTAWKNAHQQQLGGQRDLAR